MGSEREGRPQQVSNYRVRNGMGGLDLRSKRRDVGLPSACLLCWEVSRRYLLELGYGT